MMLLVSTKNVSAFNVYLAAVDEVEDLAGGEEVVTSLTS
jgi:hypothetical protein